MRAARVALTYDATAIHPMHEFVCESPRVEREVVLQEKVLDGVTTMLLYVEGEPSAYEPVLESAPFVEEFYVAPEGEDGFHLYVREETRDRESRLAASFERETVMVVPPVEIRSDRTMVLSLVGRAGDLQAVLDDVPGGVSVEVLAIGDYATVVGSSLTERQRAAVEAAWSVGYYEVPRDGGVEAVADELDCAVSTASDLLRRAEARLVADLLGERLP